MKDFFQKLGKSLMLPVAVLPVCGILMGLGYLLCPGAMQGGAITTLGQNIGYILVKAGGAVINNISWLFVLGVAAGMSDDGHISAALCGLVSWLMIITLLSTETIGTVQPSVIDDPAVRMAFDKIQNPLIAMLAGVVGASCYNRFRGTELPSYLAFFSGRRFSIIISAVVSMAAAVILSFAWPAAFTGLVAVGRCGMESWHVYVRFLCPDHVRYRGSCACLVQTFRQQKGGKGYTYFLGSLCVYQRSYGTI